MRKILVVDEPFEKDSTGTVAKIITSSQPMVGIWWLVMGECYAFQENAHECPQGRIVCTNKEHSRVFHKLQEMLSSEIPEIKAVRYNEVERGRVWFVPATKGYLITCSTEISESPKAINRIKEAFGISSKMVQVRVEVQYDVFETKLK